MNRDWGLRGKEQYGYTHDQPEFGMQKGNTFDLDEDRGIYYMENYPLMKDGNHVIGAFNGPYGYTNSKKKSL